MRGRRPSEICPVPFAAQSDPQALLHDIGGNRSVMSVDQRVLVDLLGRDGPLGDSTKTLLTRSFTCLVAANGLMNTKIAPLRLALSVSRSATRRFGAPMTMAASSCIAGVCWWWYATAVAAAMLTNPINQARDESRATHQHLLQRFGERLRRPQVHSRGCCCAWDKRDHVEEQAPRFPRVRAAPSVPWPRADRDDGVHDPRRLGGHLLAASRPVVPTSLLTRSRIKTTWCRRPCGKTGITVTTGRSQPVFYSDKQDEAYAACTYPDKNELSCSAMTQG